MEETNRKVSETDKCLEVNSEWLTKTGAITAAGAIKPSKHNGFNLCATTQQFGNIYGRYHRMYDSGQQYGHMSINTPGNFCPTQLYSGGYNLEGLDAASGSTGATPLGFILNIVPSNAGATFSVNNSVLAIVFLVVVCGLCMNKIGLGNESAIHNK